MALRACARVIRGASSEDEPRRGHLAARESLDGVAAQIQHGLNDVVRIHGERRQAWVVIAIDGDTFGCFAAQQMKNALQELVNVDQLLRGRAPRAEHGVEQIGETVGLADDDARIFA
jgi:hypothetical protein